MGFFKGHSDKSPAPTPVPAGEGKISLAKGQSVTLTKTGQPVVVENRWTAKGKDYDLKGYVLYRDGRKVYIGAANTDEKLQTPEGAISHSGDSKTPGVPERLTIKWHPEIARVALSSYSALENGVGSFREYGVSVLIKNGAQEVTIAAASTSANSSSYTLCFGEVVFGEQEGELEVVNHEMYSRSGSEKRVGYKGTTVTMDAGPEGQRKS